MSPHVPASLLCSELPSIVVSHKQGCADQTVHACWVAAWLCYARPAVTRSPISVPYLATLRPHPACTFIFLPPPPALGSLTSVVPVVSHMALSCSGPKQTLSAHSIISHVPAPPTTSHLARKDLSSPPGSNCLSNIQTGLPPLALRLVSSALCSHLPPL